MSYCYSNDGQSMRAVDPDYQSQPGEVVFDHYATDSELDAAFPGRVGLRLINLRTSRLGDINAHAAKLLATLSANYPEGEVQSWSQQTKEADALAANPDAPTPLLSAIATARGLSVGDLAMRVHTKANAYARASGQIIGQRQAMEDALLAIDLSAKDAVAQMEAVQWPTA